MRLEQTPSNRKPPYLQGSAAAAVCSSDISSLCSKAEAVPGWTGGRHLGKHQSPSNQPQLCSLEHLEEGESKALPKPTWAPPNPTISDLRLQRFELGLFTVGTASFPQESTTVFMDVKLTDQCTTQHTAVPLLPLSGPVPLSLQQVRRIAPTTDGRRLPAPRSWLRDGK